MFEMSQREEMISILSDMSKDAYGFRMRKDYSSYTETDLREEMEFLQIQVNAQIEIDRANEEDAIARFESFIAKMMTDYGIDRATAVRWDMQAEDYEPWEIERYVWSKGLPYTYENRVMTG